MWDFYQILKMLLLTSCSLGAVQAARLQRMHVNREKITLSGFSSGGTFAQQLQFSYSSLFSGIAVFSHTYYRCGPGNGVQKDYDDVCTKLGNFTNDKLYNPKDALKDVERYHKAGLIEDPSNLQDQKLYVYAGLKNFLFSTDMSLRILEIYEKYIKNANKVRTVVQNAGLVLPTESFGQPCAESNDGKMFFIGQCGYNGPLDALQWLLGTTAVKKPKKTQSRSLEPLEEFDQTEFFPKQRNDMEKVGYIYTPKACKTRHQHNHHSHGHQAPFHGCYLHFYFHGCFTAKEFVGDQHIKNSGYLEIAEANNIIMVFPQNKNSTENTIGCWDTYGFTGRDYATQKGGQVQTVRKILERILGEDLVNSKNGPINFGPGPIPTDPQFFPFGQIP